MAAENRFAKPKQVKLVSAVAVGAVLALAAADPAKSADSFDFNLYRVPKTYSGKLRLPDFKARDKEFADFRTRIIDAMKAGATFAGENSVAQFGCGTGCTHTVVANNRNGRLYWFPRGGEFNQGLTLEFKTNSNLMLARWFTDSLWETCVIESFVLDDKGRWIAKEALAGRGEAICDGGIAAGASKARGF